MCLGQTMQIKDVCTKALKTIEFTWEKKFTKLSSALLKVLLMIVGWEK